MLKTTKKLHIGSRPYRLLRHTFDLEIPVYKKAHVFH